MTQHWPQARKQGLFLCRAQGWWGEEPWLSAKRRGREACRVALGPLLSQFPFTSEGLRELVQEKGHFISINTPALTHTLTTPAHKQMDRGETPTGGPAEAQE